MKAVILAGGLGTRIGEETTNRPKPMIEIGDRPILWHIMKVYAHYGITDFIICCGYKGYIVKEYFVNYLAHIGDVTIDLQKNRINHSQPYVEPWNITLVDTGQATMTGGRLGRIKKYLEGEDSFCMTYGDGLSNVDIGKLISFHKKHGKKATITGVHPPARFGALEVNDQSDVTLFNEKPFGEGGYINGGFFVLSTDVLSLIEGDATVWEEGPLRSLSSLGDLKVFLHHDFWQPMDTMRDKIYLDDLWKSGQAPWKIWADNKLEK